MKVRRFLLAGHVELRDAPSHRSRQAQGPRGIPRERPEQRRVLEAVRAIRPRCSPLIGLRRPRQQKIGIRAAAERQVLEQSGLERREILVRVGAQGGGMKRLERRLGRAARCECKHRQVGQCLRPGEPTQRLLRAVERRNEVAGSLQAPGRGQRIALVLGWIDGQGPAPWGSRSVQRQATFRITVRRPRGVARGCVASIRVTDATPAPRHQRSAATLSAFTPLRLSYTPVSRALFLACTLAATAVATHAFTGAAMAIRCDPS